MKQRKTILCVAVTLLAIMIAAPVAAQVKSYTKIKYPTLPEFKIDKPEVYTLDNGMKVFLMEDHELPLISASMRIRTGANYDPEDKTGLGGIFGQVQREGGTKSMTGEELDEWLGARAASIETGVGGDSGSASMNCLKEDFDEVFAVFGDVLRKPVFAEDKLDVAKTQTNSVISRRNDDISGITGREFRRLIYGKDSPLGRLTEYATVAAITRDDLVAWHKQYYHPNNIYLGIVGDFDSAEMKRTIQKTFGDWAEGPAFDAPEIPYQQALKPGRYVIEKEDVTQAYVRLGHLGINSKNPDFFAVQVMNEVLGGGFSSRMFSHVRSEKGLAYSVFGRVGSSFVRQGIFQAGLSTKSETMAASVDALKEEIQGIIDDPASKDEMARAKESILNSFVFRYASKSGILNQIMAYDFYGMPDDYLQTYRDNIEAVTSEDVARVAKTYIHPDKLVMLVVGKSADFDKPVKSFGDVAELDITIPPPADTRPEVAKSNESLEAGTALFSKVVDALSDEGADKIETIKASYTIAFDMGGQKMSVGQEVDFALPDKLRQTVKTPMGNQVVVLNGNQGMMQAGGQSQPIPEDRIGESFEGFHRDLLMLTDNLGSPDLEAVAAGSEEVDGASCEVVSVTYKGTESRLFVDGTGKVVKQSYQGKHPFRGTPGLIEVRFSEYNDVEGRLIPHKRVMTFEGQELATVTVDTIELNADMDATAFEISTN